MIYEREKVSEIIKEGEEAYLKKDFKKAVDLLKLSLEKDPENLESHYFLGIVYTRLFDYDNSISHFKKIISSNFGFIYINHVRTVLGYIYALKGEYLNAKNCLEDALKFNPNNFHALSTMAFLFYKEKSYDKAIETYNRILEIQPENPNSLNSIGFIYIESGKDINKGIETCEKALTLSPNNPAYLDSIGWGFYRKGEENKAVEYLRQAFEIAPDNNEIKNHLREILKI